MIPGGGGELQAERQKETGAGTLGGELAECREVSIATAQVVTKMREYRAECHQCLLQYV